MADVNKTMRTPTHTLPTGRSQGVANVLFPAYKKTRSGEQPMIMLTLRARCLATLLLLVSHPGLARAEVFTLDPARSRLTLSGSVHFSGLTAPLTQQGAGSLTTSYAGSIHVARSDGTLSFTSDSYVDALPSGVWQPGNAPADYGARAAALFFSGTMAMRNIAFDLSSTNLSLVNGQFDPRALTFSFITNANGIVDYTSNVGLSGSIPLAGTATNASTGAASLSIQNGQQELLIPIDGTYRIETGDLAGSSFRMVGQLTATAPIPPRIASIRIQDNQVVLSVTNAAPDSVLWISTDLTDWTSAGLSASNSAGVSYFTTPATEPKAFFRIQK